MLSDIDAILRSPNWYRALSLRERAATLETVAPVAAAPAPPAAPAASAAPSADRCDGGDAGDSRGPSNAPDPGNARGAHDARDSRDSHDSHDAHDSREARDARDSNTAARAARLLGRWQAQSPFTQDGFFARRLAADGLDVERLTALLGEPPAALAERIRAVTAPAVTAAGAGERDTAAALPWLADLADAFSRTPPAGEPGFPPAAIAACGRQGALLAVVRPLLDRGFARLAAALADLARRSGTALFAPDQAALLLAAALPQRLVYLLGRCMAVELHLAADAGQLAGETPEERHASFVARLGDPAAALALLCKYPVAARQAVEMVERWVAFGRELCGYLVDDAPRLAELLDAPHGVGALCGLDVGLGDPHRGGRSVCRLRFDSGLQAIYKPRSMAVEAAFQELLAWTARRGFVPSFARLRVLDAGDHGWAEVVRAAPCGSADEVRRFYQRQGGYLALLFALSATDMHHENLIAAGEHPNLVDLEALFHPLDENWGRQAEDETPVPDTVLRVGLLPANWGGKDARDGIDLSGLAAAAGQAAPRPVLRTTDPGTDRMRFVHAPMQVPVGEHRPTLGGAVVELGPYADAVAGGCQRMLRLLAAHRDELLADDGPLAAFAALPVRVLVRLTFGYGSLMIDAQHPFALGDGLERDRLFDRLWAVTAEQPSLGRMVPAERRDLWRGDVPMFTALPAGRDVWTSDGERLPALLGQSGLDGVRNRLRRLDDAEIERQVWLVGSSLRGAAGVLASWPAYMPDGAGAAPAARDLLDAAVAVGRRLEALAFRGPAGTVWFGCEPQGGTPTARLGPAGPDLYLGIPGIALLFAHLGAVLADAGADVSGSAGSAGNAGNRGNAGTASSAAGGTGGDDFALAARWTALARSAVRTLRDEVVPGSELVESIGAFSGWGGVLYTYTHLGLLWGDAELLDAAEAVAERLAPAIAADENCDLMSGAAGCLVCLLRLWQHRRKQRLLALATACGEQLLARAVQPEPPARGLGWVMAVAGPQPLAGFGHGAAGIAWALLQLAEAAGDARFSAAALAAHEYERSLFSPGESNWPDLRAGAGPPGGGLHFMSAWCHGAAGIALGRLDSLVRLDGAEARRAGDEARAAVATILARGFGNGHCLCHGDLGCLEALTLAAEVLDEPDLVRRAGGIAGGVLADIRDNGWRHGLMTDVEVPGLMVGLAGIGYGLLRLAAPRRVPSVLLLGLPPESTATSRSEGAG